MTTETYYISKRQFLANLEPFATTGLPTNSIIHKKITGCGATTLELKFPRNSIIIEPNLPVILGKCKKMNGTKRKNKVIQGVYEGIDVATITNYLKDCKGYKKIMTTPEAFWKIAEAIGATMFKDYFLLFDECEKAIQDIDFRNAIIDPIDAFFQFDNKAFVSATPILPSDPRFKNFKHVIIEPDYDHSNPITVFTTNNVLFKLKELLDALKTNDENRKYFIFLKATTRIKAVINRLKLEDCAVYCSEKSAKELRTDGINAFDKINDSFKKYNFLTSRFFSAVDIDYTEYQCDPIIIMVSDVIAVEHTIIDPHTEAIQICGRFRAPEYEGITIIKTIYHVSNYSSKLTSYNKTEVEAILKDKKSLHEFIVRFQPKFDVEYINKFIDEIITLNGFKYFLKEKDGRLNHFMVDHFTNEEQIKGYYRASKSLINQYRKLKHFTIEKMSGYTHYVLTDEEMLSISNGSKQNLNKLVASKVKTVMESGSAYASLSLMMLRLAYPSQMEVLDNYGLKNAAAFDYDIDTIQQNINDAKSLHRLIPILKYIQNAFVKRKYTSAEIESILSIGIKQTGLYELKPGVKLLKNGAILSERCNVEQKDDGTWIKGYEVLGFLQNFDLDSK